MAENALNPRNMNAKPVLMNYRMGRTGRCWQSARSGTEAVGGGQEVGGRKKEVENNEKQTILRDTSYKGNGYISSKSCQRTKVERGTLTEGKNLRETIYHNVPILSSRSMRSKSF